jgi:hypothetical protein
VICDLGLLVIRHLPLVTALVIPRRPERKNKSKCKTQKSKVKTWAARNSAAHCAVILSIDSLSDAHDGQKLDKENPCCLQSS